MNSKQMLDRLKINLSMKTARDRVIWLDGELVEYLNEAQEFVAAQLMSMYENFFVTATTLTTVSGTELYDLPSDFISAKKVEWVNSAAPSELMPIKFEERNYYLLQNQTLFYTLYGYWSSVYYLLNNQIGILPIPTSNENDAIKIWYVKRLADMDGASATTSEIPVELHRLVVIHATVMALEKPDAAQYISDRILQVWRERLDALLKNMIMVVDDRRIQQPQFAVHYERE